MLRLCMPIVALLASGASVAADESSTNRSKPVASSRFDSQRPFTVVIELKQPYRENADAFIAATGLRLYGRVARGSLSTELTRTRLRRVLGLSFTLSVIKGAGNSTGADAHVAEIRNPQALKAELKPLLRRVWINTDPKREVGEAEPEYRSSRRTIDAATSATNAPPPGPRSAPSP